MARIVNRFAEPPTNLLVPRDDVVHEVREEDGSFTADGGPFTAYRRVVDTQGGLTVETIEYSLAVPYFGFLFAPLTRRALRSHETNAMPWWAPPERLDPRGSTALGVLCAVALIVGYLNTLLTQTIAFAADEFGSSDRAQGVSLAIVRCGVVLALIIGGMADRQGRRRLILGLAIAGPIVSATGALAPSLAWLTVSQTVARPLAMALGILVAVVAIEEMPAGSRAYTISLLAMATALGAGACVVALPLADLGIRGWRLVYVVPLLGLLLVPGVEPQARGEPPLRSTPRRRELLGPRGPLLAAGRVRDAAEPLRRAGLRVPEPIPEERAWLLGESHLAAHPGHEHAGRHRDHRRRPPRRHARPSHRRLHRALRRHGVHRLVLLRERVDALGRVDHRGDRGGSGGARARRLQRRALSHIAARPGQRGDHRARARRQWRRA